MRAYGTNIVGGTSTRTDMTEAAGVQVFPDCAAAVAATGAVATVAMAPPMETRAAVHEALDAGIKLIVTVAEGIPLHDAIAIGRAVRAAGATWIGGSTPGMAIPGEIKLGFLPDVCLRPGPLAIMSKSGTLSYEAGYRLAREGLGQSLWIGVGGDPVKGVRFADLLPVFFADKRTAGIVLVGRSAARRKRTAPKLYASLGARKPLYALIAGREAKEGVSMGHAGALVFGETGTIQSKTQTSARRRGAGIRHGGRPGRNLCAGLRGSTHVKQLSGGTTMPNVSIQKRSVHRCKPTPRRMPRCTNSLPWSICRRPRPSTRASSAANR